jgi:hypothetical protein
VPVGVEGSHIGENAGNDHVGLELHAGARGDGDVVERLTTACAVMFELAIMKLLRFKPGLVAIGPVTFQENAPVFAVPAVSATPEKSIGLHARVFWRMSLPGRWRVRDTGGGSLVDGNGPRRNFRGAKVDYDGADGQDGTGRSEEQRSEVMFL